MGFVEQNLVNFVIFSPLLFAALVALLPSSEKGQLRAWTLVGMFVNFGLALWMYLRFDPHGAEFQMQSRLHWIDELGTSYHTGVDGLAVSLMLLTGFLGPFVVLASWRSVNERVKAFHLALLFIQTAMMGALGSIDVVLFYMFFEGMLIPMYLLVGVWGSEERQKAAVKFFLYTLVGSLLMLVAIIAVYFLGQKAGSRSFDYATMYNSLTAANKELSQCASLPGTCASMSATAVSLKAFGPLLFLAFALAFAIKVPMFPVHTWLPDAHVQAPVAGSMILAGVMLKMGTFGFWRYAIPLFPTINHAFRPLLAALAVVGIVYGALMCLAQQDIKKLIAYSSVSHLGYCMLGMLALTPEGATGSAYQMLNHGVSTGALFLLFGFLYERRHTRLMSDYGGIAKVMPVFAASFVIITFSSVAVPGTNGFIGEFLVLLGAFKATGLSTWFGVTGTLGVILGAAYMLWMVQRVFFGRLTHQDNLGLKDLNGRELFAVVPFVLLVLVMGLNPQPFLDRIAPSTQRFVARANLEPGSADNLVRIDVMPLPETGAGRLAAERAPVLPATPPPPSFADAENPSRKPVLP